KNFGLNSNENSGISCLFSLPLAMHFTMLFCAFLNRSCYIVIVVLLDKTFRCNNVPTENSCLYGKTICSFQSMLFSVKMTIVVLLEKGMLLNDI
ncbi:MAG: hypothetical protein LBR91_01855, partial [Puniceicoccales bacterium]|nr:hypothetical protein [Puniceicoccales bacterium]